MSFNTSIKQVTNNQQLSTQTNTKEECKSNGNDNVLKKSVSVETERAGLIELGSKGILSGLYKIFEKETKEMLAAEKEGKLPKEAQSYLYFGKVRVLMRTDLLLKNNIRDKLKTDLEDLSPAHKNCYKVLLEKCIEKLDEQGNITTSCFLGDCEPKIIKNTQGTYNFAESNILCSKVLNAVLTLKEEKIKLFKN